MPNAKPTVVLLVGSSAMREEYISEIERLACQGKAAVGLTPVKSQWAEEYAHAHGLPTPPMPEAQRQQLSDFKFSLLDIADEVRVVNKGGYVGEDSMRLIGEAESRGIPISYTAEAPA